MANAGILILRLADKNKAIGLYCYFFSNEGFTHLKRIYEQSGEGMVYINELLASSIPPRYLLEGKERMQEIESLKHEFESLETKLQDLKQT